VCGSLKLPYASQPLICNSLSTLGGERTLKKQRPGTNGGRTRSRKGTIGAKHETVRLGILKRRVKKEADKGDAETDSFAAERSVGMEHYGDPEPTGIRQKRTRAARELKPPKKDHRNHSQGGRSNQARARWGGKGRRQKPQRNLNRTHVSRKCDLWETSGGGTKIGNLLGKSVNHGGTVEVQTQEGPIGPEEKKHSRAQSK